jgi:hypothetical protein
LTRGTYKDYSFTYETNSDGSITVYSAFRGNFQCSYKCTFESLEALKRFIDNGGWSLKR